MEEADIKAPLYYVMGRDIGEADKLAAHYVFTITPCYTGVVSRPSDLTVIQFLTQEVLRAADENACAEIAAHVARASGLPVLTVGEGKELKAVYPNGDEEILCLSKLTSTN